MDDLRGGEEVRTGLTRAAREVGGRGGVKEVTRL